MTLTEHIDDIRDNLQADMYPDETSVSDYVVRRLIHRGLQWPEYTPNIVVREYPVEIGKVDFALCHPPSKPVIFIEVKRVGNADGAEEQIFKYAYHGTVDIIVLTDGRIWHFFYPKGSGDYEARRVCTLDLTKKGSEESARVLNRYLNYEAVCKSEAERVIKQDYESLVNQREIEKRLPEVWSALLQEENEDLLLAVMEKSKHLDVDPTEKQVLAFLKSLKIEPIIIERPSKKRGTDESFRHEAGRKKARRLRVTFTDGTVISGTKLIDTWLDTIKRIGVDRVMSVDPKEQIISATPNFRPGRAEVRFNQYYITKDYGVEVKKKHLDRISSELGLDLDVEIID